MPRNSVPLFIHLAALMLLQAEHFLDGVFSFLFFHTSAYFQAALKQIRPSLISPPVRSSPYIRDPSLSPAHGAAPPGLHYITALKIF